VSCDQHDRFGTPVRIRARNPEHLPDIVVTRIYGNSRMKMPLAQIVVATALVPSPLEESPQARYATLKP
jgi:hypothetical protein